MSFSFGNYYSNIIVDENADQNTVYFFSPEYKNVPIGTGEPPTFRTEIDWDATSKASAVIYNIGERK